MKESTGRRDPKESRGVSLLVDAGVINKRLENRDSQIFGKSSTLVRTWSPDRIPDSVSSVVTDKQLYLGHVFVLSRREGS